MAEPRAFAAAQHANQLPRRPAHLKIAMHISVQPAIEVGGEGSAIQHREIAGIRPIALSTEILLDALVKTGARQRIRHRNAELVGLRAAQKPDGLGDIVRVLARVTELDEMADANTCRLQEASRIADLR